MKFIFNGECHLLFLLYSEGFKEGLGKYGGVVNSCIGSWLIGSSIEHMLWYDLSEIEDGDIFVLGFANGIDGESSEGRRASFLESINRIEYKYPNSKIIFVTFPVKEEDKSYEQYLEKVSLRESVVNKRNIFHLKIQESDFKDSGHLTWDGYVRASKELLKYIESNLERLKVTRYERVKAERVMSFGRNKYVEVVVLYHGSDSGDELKSKFMSGDSLEIKEIGGSGIRVWNKRYHVIRIFDLRYIEVNEELEVVGCRKINF
jgi:hypothetical protein